MENRNQIPIKIVTKTSRKSNSDSLPKKLSSRRSKSTSSMSKLTGKLTRNKQTSFKKNGYNVRSKGSLLKDIKNTAINSINHVQKRLNSFSTLLKPNKSKSDLENYDQITNQPTPVKLYSPFSIETPTTVKPTERMRLRQQLFTSPQNKLKDDIENLGYSINRLNLMMEKMPDQYRINNDHQQSSSGEEKENPSIVQQSKTVRRHYIYETESLI